MTDRIKLNDLRRQYVPLREEILAAIDGVFQDMNLFIGPNTRAFEHEWAEYCGTAHAIGVDNGTDALVIALRAYQIGKGDEVITPANTFVAVVEAIYDVGATPVFIDIDPATYTMNVQAFEAAITSRTRAVIPVHLYGVAADMDAINAIARAHGILVIEDASQAQGAEYKNKRVGSLGDSACFSLYYTKNLGGYGESGILTTNSSQIAETASMLRQHGADPQSRYHTKISGYNSRLDEIQAAILRIKLKYLNIWNEQRRQLAEQYTRLLKDVVVTPTIPAYANPVYYVYVIRTPQRDVVKARLFEAGVESGIHYPIPLHLQPMCVEYGYQEGQFPVTERYAREILSLPMFAELTGEEVERISSAVKDAVHDTSPASIANIQ